MENNSFVGALSKCAHFLFPGYLRKIIIFTLIFCTALGLFASSCSQQGNAVQSGNATGAGEPQGYHISVKFNGNVTDILTIDDLNKLEQFNVRNLDHDCNGPTLMSVLKQAGVIEFNEVKIGGVNRGRVAVAELTLQKAQITDNTILDITNRGTSKFTDAVIPFEQWIYDVTDIDVK